MARYNRIEDLCSYISNKQEASVEELSEYFSVSKETIRRDLKQLSKDKKVIRTRGGAVAVDTKSVPDNRYFARSEINPDAKRRIAKKVNDYIRNCYTLGFDSSTTTYEAVKLLKDKDKMTVITNSAYAVCALADSEFNIAATGGFLDKSTLAFTGTQAKVALDNYNIDIALISCTGLSRGAGFTDSVEDDATFKQTMMKRANKILLLADHSKFDRITFIKIGSFEQIDVLVTDVYPGKEWEEELKNAGVELIY